MKYKNILIVLIPLRIISSIMLIVSIPSTLTTISTVIIFYFNSIFLIDLKSLFNMVEIEKKRLVGQFNFC